MRRTRKRPHEGEDFEAKYAPQRSRTARQVERLAFGHDVGLQGYTTLEQAKALVKHLDLDSASLLLDLGAGRGWPGTLIARSAGCRLLSTDIPFDALLEAKARTSKWEPAGSCQVLGADGQALPFSSESIDAIVHADVFC